MSRKVEKYTTNLFAVSKESASWLFLGRYRKARLLRNGMNNKYRQLFVQ